MVENEPPEDRGDTPPDAWKGSLLAVAITALLLLTFVVLFTAATGTTPAWWPG